MRAVAQSPIPSTTIMSSPTKPVQSSKPRKKATVTPRSFGRFFTPRTSLERLRKNGARRRVFGDITILATNQRASKRRRIHDDTLVPISGFEEESLGFKDILSIQQQNYCTPETTPERSSPLRRYDVPGQCASTSPHGARVNSATDLVPGFDAIGHHPRKFPRPLVKARYHSLIGGRVRREIGSTMEASKSRYCETWQNETTNFYSRPEDVHVCHNLNTQVQEKALPFCTASCKTNSLVAIGDEEGGVRLLESSEDGSPSFNRKYLSFRPHANAILDLAFSSDDMLLATASGDQTSKIIDMSSQRAIRTLSGHVSSVKQVCFQPGSGNNVIATSSRDGTVQIWDLRSRALEQPVGCVKVSLDGVSTDSGYDPPTSGMTWAIPVYTIDRAHVVRRTTTPSSGRLAAKPPSNLVRNTKSELSGRRAEASITGLCFLPPSRSHLLLTSSEANASIKLWDLRFTHKPRRGSPTPLSTTRQPESHDLYRKFGLTSLVLSNDGGRIYSLCRDNTVYVYSTSHLVLGSAPELQSSMARPQRSGGTEKEGLGPLYGMRHSKLHAASFYVKLAIRAAKEDKSELLAVGSSDCCAVVFPTNEGYMYHQENRGLEFSADASSTSFRSSSLTRSSQERLSNEVELVSERLDSTIPIYQHGSALVRGHDKEVTGMSWTSEGELVTVGDDFQARVWREGSEAQDLRTGGENGGRRWGHGWAECLPGWDEDC